MVVPQRQRSGTGQTVDEMAPFDVLDINALGAFQRQGNTPWVAAGIGFLLVLTGQQRRFIELLQRFGRRRDDPGRLIFDKAGSD